MSAAKDVSCERPGVPRASVMLGVEQLVLAVMEEKSCDNEARGPPGISQGCAVQYAAVQLLCRSW